MNNSGIRPPLHRRSRRCSSLKYTGYARSSRLALAAHQRPRCSELFMTGPLPARDRHASVSHVMEREQKIAALLRSALVTTVDG